MDTSGLNVKVTDFAIVFERKTLPGENEPEDENRGQFNGVDCVREATAFAEADIIDPRKDHKWVKVTEADEPVPGKEVTWVLIDPDGTNVAVVQWQRTVV